MYTILTLLVSLAVVAGLQFHRVDEPSSKWKLDEAPRFSADSLLTMHLALVPSSADVLTEKVSTIADPKSPDFRNYLTNEQLSELIGSSQDNLDKILNWVKKSGFELLEIYPSRDWVTVRASLGAVEKCLQTKLASWTEETSGKVQLGALESYTIPDHLAGVIQFIPGLTSPFSSATWHSLDDASVRDPPTTNLPSVQNDDLLLYSDDEKSARYSSVAAAASFPTPSSQKTSQLELMIHDPLMDHAYVISNTDAPPLVHYLAGVECNGAVDKIRTERLEYELKKMAARGITVLLDRATKYAHCPEPLDSRLSALPYTTTVNSVDPSTTANRDSLPRLVLSETHGSRSISGSVSAVAELIARVNHELLSAGWSPLGWLSPWLAANPQLLYPESLKNITADEDVEGDGASTASGARGTRTSLYSTMLEAAFQSKSSAAKRGLLSSKSRIHSNHLSKLTALSVTYDNIDAANLPTGSTTTFLGPIANNNCGRQVANIGDFNHDTYSDFAVGCFNAENGRGIVFVIFGKGAAWDATIDLTTITAGTGGFRVIGGSVNYKMGGPAMITGIGDTNGDGIDDFVIGVSMFGCGFIIYGKTSGFADITVSSSGAAAPTSQAVAAAQAAGWRLIYSSAPGAGQVPASGGNGGVYSIAAAGDLNGDGMSDFLVGAPFVASLGTATSRAGAGRVFLCLGQKTFTTAYTLLSRDSSIPLAIGGALAQEYLGGFWDSTFGSTSYTTGASTQKTLATMDLDGDGLLDIVMGSPTRRVDTSNPNVGAVTVLYGQSTGFGTADIDLGVSLATGVGFVITGPHLNAYFGAAVANADDVNGDGIDDLLIGCYGRRAPTTTDVYGGAYVVFGKSAWYTSFDISDMIAGPTTGFAMYGPAPTSYFGVSVGSAGDINNDGIKDFYVGASVDKITTNGASTAVGAVYFIFGQDYLTGTFTDQYMANFAAGSAGFKFIGLPGTTSTTSTMVGLAVSRVGDTNGDGVDEFLIGAQRAAHSGKNLAGLMYLYTPPKPAGAAVQPTSLPSRQPTGQPSSLPSAQPFARPTSHPSAQPMSHPSGQPSSQPSSRPSAQPTSSPPTARPSGNPTTQPSTQPSSCPTSQPSSRPSDAPTSRPSASPTSEPSTRPSARPSSKPSSAPSGPTSSPSSQPSSTPTGQPSVRPSSRPVAAPSAQPSSVPSAQPSAAPTTEPTSQPTAQPSGVPSAQPVLKPTSCPSSSPSAQPSVTPSSQPSNTPSAQPSAAPSSDPTGQPTGVPSAQPVQRPTSVPTAAPSARPTSAPLTKPTSVPSAQPSAQPSSEPSSQPSSAPSTPPSAQPTSEPSTQPSGVPSAQPVQRPSAHPTSAPSAQPSSVPSTAPTTTPSTQPSSQPSRRPTSQPSALPTGKPTGQPSAEPSSQPSVQPSLVPSVLPSSQPVAVPTSQPTTVPSGRPSSQPIALPSSVPSAQPTGAPSAQPSVQPSGAPSAVPSAQPTPVPSSVPTAQPSMRPSARPSAVPSSQPSSSPSTQPTCEPTTQPSGEPSSQPSTQPSIQPSSLPTSQPSSHPTTQPSSRPSAQPSSQPSAQPSTQPSSVPSAQPSEVPSNQPSAVPSTQPSRQPSSVPSSQPTEQPSTQPSVVPSGQPSGRPSAQPSNRPSAQPSAVPTTQPSGQPTVAPSRPTIAPTPTPPTVRPTVSPYARPSTKPTYTPGVPTASPVPTAVPSFAPTLHPTATRTVAPTLDPAAPVLTVTLASTTRSTITLAVAMSSALHSGSVTCAAFRKGATVATVDKVLTSGTSKAYLVGATKATVTVASLLSVTDYDTYCAATTTAGVVSLLSDVTATKLSVQTACCNVLSYTVAPRYVYGDLAKYTTTTMPFFKYALSAAPRQWLVVSPVVRNAAGSVVSSGVVTVQPASANFTSTAGLSGSFLLAASGLLNGTYTVTLEVTGASAADYATTTATTVELLASSTLRPAPAMQKAQFADNGAAIVVTFDSATDRASITKHSFPCHSLFAFLGVNSTACAWTSSSTVRVVFDAAPAGTNLIVVGGKVYLSANRVKAACSGTTAVCAANAYSSAQVVTVEAPAVSVVPTVVLRVPAVVSGCSDVIIDHTLSSGSGGRAWKDLTWTATEETAATSGAATAIKNTLSAYGASTSAPLSIPKSLISSARYTLSLTLTNFLDQVSSGTVVFTTDDNPNLPMVSIVGPPVVTAVPSDVLSVFSAAARTPCAIAGSSMSYTWTVTQNGAVQGFVPIVATATKFALAPYTLAALTVYTVIVTATASASTDPAYPAVSASASVTIQVGSGRLVAVVVGGSFRSLSSSDQALTLDASQSYDQGYPPGSSATAATKSFVWSCSIASAASYGASCADKLPAVTDGSVLNVAAAGLTYGELYVFTVTVSTADGRSDSYAVTVQNSAGSTVTSISNVALTKVLPSKKLVLMGFVQGGYALDAQWSAWIDGVSQSFTATTPLTGTFSSALVANSFVYPLAVPANTFTAGSVVTFRISAHFAGNASLFASYSDVTITMNSPPTGGALSVDPTNGDALSHVFALSSYGWTDDAADYPLTYEFAYRLTSKQAPLTVQTRTASTVTSTTLPAGLSAQGHGVTLISTVYDNFLATASATTGAVVTASADVDVVAYVAAQVESANAAGNMDMFAQIVANAGSSLGVVNCSAASDSFCAGLNRGACFATPQKCSACLEGYTGLSGDGNTMCRNDGAALNGTGAGCATHDDCAYGMCVSGVCEVPTLECPSTTADVCSDHGVCDYFDRNGRGYGFVCLLTDVDCIARCSCADGYGGLSCSLSTDEVELRSQTRAQLCQAVIEVGNTVDPSSFALDMLVSALNSAYDPHEVVAAADVATCYDALALLTDLSAAGYLSEESSAQMVNVAAKFVLNAGTAVAPTTTRRALNENVAVANRSARVDSAVSGIVTGILGNMAHGETPVSYSNSEIDLTVYKSLASDLSVLSAPQTSAINTYMEITNTTAEVLQTESGYIEASALLWLNNPFPQSDVLQSSLFRVEVFNAVTETRRRAQESVRNGTEAAFYVLGQFTAPQDFNFTLTLDAAIRLGPVNYTIPQCTNYVDGVYEKCGGCWVDTYTNDNVTYGCPLSALYNTTESARRLQAATDDAAGVGGSQLVQFTTLHAYVDTFAAVGGPGDFHINWDKSKIVLAFLATLTFLIIVGFVVFLKRDHNKEESARSTRGELARSGGAWQEHSPVPASPTTDAAGAVSTSDVQYDEIYANSCAEDVESLSRGTSPAVVLLFAQELCAPPLSLWQSLCQHHKYLAVLCADSERVSHTVKWARLTMGFLLYLFFTTVFFGVFYPDDGLCQDHHNVDSCLSSDSRVTNTHLCEWSIDTSTNIGSCGLNAPPRTFVFLIVVVMVVVVVSVPFQVAYDYLLMCVCRRRPRFEEWGFPTSPAVNHGCTDNQQATSPYITNSVYDGTMSVHDEVLQVVEQASAHMRSVPADVPESAKLKAIHDDVAVSADGSQWNVHGAVASARSQSALIESRIISMTEKHVEARSAVLMEYFLLEQFSAFKQFVLRRYLFDMALTSSTSVCPLLWVLSWAWIVISMMFFLAWAFAWACTQGGSTFAAWGIVIGTALAQDLLVIEVFRVWVMYVLSMNATRPQLLAICSVLQRVGQSHRHSELGDSTSDLHVCQHLSPACRAAHIESLYYLPIAHVLRSVDDADVAACHDQQNVSLPIIATVTLALPVVLSVLHDTLGVVAMGMLLPAFFDAVLIMSRYVYAGAGLFILVLYLFPAVLYVLCVVIIKPAFEEANQQNQNKGATDDTSKMDVVVSNKNEENI